MKSIKKHSVKSCAINKISQFSSFKILKKIQNLLNILKLIQGGIERTPPHHIYQILYNFLSERDDCTPPKCGALSEYTVQMMKLELYRMATRNPIGWEQ